MPDIKGDNGSYLLLQHMVHTQMNPAIYPQYAQNGEDPTGAALYAQPSQQPYPQVSTADGSLKDQQVAGQPAVTVSVANGVEQQTVRSVKLFSLFTRITHNVINMKLKVRPAREKTCS